jgi:catecholate siderophore receptor
MNPTEHSPKKTVYFGLRQEILGEMITQSEGALPLRSGPAALRRGVSVATTVALVNALSLTAAAQVAATNTHELSEVVVTAPGESGYKPESVASPKYTGPLRDVPQTITVVPEQVIREQGATTLRDVVRNVPGISIQAGEGGVPAGDNLSIRGFNARTDLFIDGVRDIGGYARDSFNFEQVEVIKGPASAYSGRGSTGGSINIETKTPRQNAFYRGEAGVGTDNYKRFTLDVNQPVLALWPKPSIATAPVGDSAGKDILEPSPAPAPEATVAVRLNAMWTEADTPRRDEAGGRRWGIAPSIAFGLGTPTNVTLSYMHLDQDNVPDYGIPWVTPTNNALVKYRDKAPPVDFNNYYGILERDYEEVVTDIGTIEVKHAFNDTNSLRYLLRYGQNKRDSLITGPRFLNDDSTALRRQLQSRDQKDTILANLLDYTTHFETWGVKHDLVVGLEYDRETQENFLRSGPEAPAADLFDPNPHVAYDGTVRRTGAKNEADTETVSLYAFDTMKLGEHWQLSGGLRYDYYSAELDQQAEDGVLTELDHIDKMLSWRAALAYKPVESGTIYVSAGTSFNPSAEGLTSNFNVDNSTLKPEKSFTYEIGTKWEFFNRRFALNVAAFRTEKENARTQGVDDLDPVVLEGEQLVQGFEIGVAGNITNDWALFGGYTFLDSETKQSANPAEIGKSLPNTPEHSFSLWTTYQLPWNLQAGVGAQFVDDRFNNAINQREAESYWNVDAMLTYRVNEHFDVRMNVYNIFDEEYIDRVGGGHFIPGAGRAATVTLSIKF